MQGNAKHSWCKYNGLFVNSPVVFIVMIIFSLSIKTCPKTCLPRVHLRQITLLKGYIRPKEQPVVFMIIIYALRFGAN